MINNIIEQLKKRGFDLTKRTHCKKTFLSHMKECYEFVKEFVEKIYPLDDRLADFALTLCALHDVGKLLPRWDLHVQQRPLHAIEGAEWLLRENEKLKLSPKLDSIYHKILAYAILTHHSSLIAPFKLQDIIYYAERHKIKNFVSYQHCKKLVKKLNDLISTIDRQTRIRLVDSIGIFKLADMVSAKNISANEIISQYCWLEGLKDRIKAEIIKRANRKLGKFNADKFRKQSEVAISCEKHLLFAAPTGWGKTAVALLRMIRIRPLKIFYILPTITAIKDFTHNLIEVFGKGQVGEYFYFADVEALKSIEEQYGDELPPLDFYRYFVPKVTITTIDQLLFSIIQVGKYHVRRFNFKDALLVFDEYHLLTPEMIAVLRLFLKEFSGIYNFSCLMMSATPSPFYKDLLLKTTQGMKNVILRDEYKGLKRHKVDVVNSYVDDFINKNIDIIQKRSTLVLVNIVSEAQHIYKLLKEAIGGRKRITLIHSKFAYKDRSRKEKQIEKTDILVSTQVAEVSLDISFDVLITEEAPIPSLVQRFGRVNRYGSIPEQTNVYICRAKSEHPYGTLPIRWARDSLDSLCNGLEKKGEAIYLDEKFWESEYLYNDKVDQFERKCSEYMEGMHDFFSFRKAEQKITEMFGREETWLAIPEQYLKNAYCLLKKMQLTSNYNQRGMLYAQIKGYLAPASPTDVRKVDWDDKLRIPVIKDYDDELGIIRS
jgi:CRISPR-associated endonuclease/helicase Cas3